MVRYGNRCQAVATCPDFLMENSQSARATYHRAPPLIWPIVLLSELRGAMFWAGIEGECLEITNYF